MLHPLSHVLDLCPALALFLSLAIGYWVGNLKIAGFRVGGVSGSLLAGIAISMIGIHIPSEMKDMFFTLFIYSVGFQSGPFFFASLGRRALREILLALTLTISSFVTIIVLARLFHLDKGIAAGIAAGGLTESAILGTAMSSLESYGLPAAMLHQLQANMATGYAITYIFGNIGTVIVCVYIVPRFMKSSIRESALKAVEHFKKEEKQGDTLNRGSEMIPDLVQRTYEVEQTGWTIKRLEERFTGVTVEQVLRDQLSVEKDREEPLYPQEIVLLVGQFSRVNKAGTTIGEEMSDDVGEHNVVVQRDVLLSKPQMVGKTVEECSERLKKGARHPIYITSVFRSGKPIDITRNLELHKGDIVKILGTVSDLQVNADMIGKLSVPSISTDVMFHAFAISMGLLIGMIVIHIGTVPLTLGSGGVLLAGIIAGWWQKRRPISGTFPLAASTLLVDLGISSFVALMGLQTGKQAVETFMHHGADLFLFGVIVTIVPLLISMVVGRYLIKYDNTAIFASALAGVRSAVPAGVEVLNVAENSVPTVPFAITYALANVLLTLLGPLIVTFA